MSAPISGMGTRLDALIANFNKNSDQLVLLDEIDQDLKFVKPSKDVWTSDVGIDAASLKTAICKMLQVDEKANGVEERFDKCLKALALNPCGKDLKVTGKQLAQIMSEFKDLNASAPAVEKPADLGLPKPGQKLKMTREELNKHLDGWLKAGYTVNVHVKGEGTYRIDERLGRDDEFHFNAFFKADGSTKEYAKDFVLPQNATFLVSLGGQAEEPKVLNIEIEDGEEKAEEPKKSDAMEQEKKTEKTEEKKEEIKKEELPEKNEDKKPETEQGHGEAVKKEEDPKPKESPKQMEELQNEDEEVSNIVNISDLDEELSQVEESKHELKQAEVKQPEIPQQDSLKQQERVEQPITNTTVGSTDGAQSIKWQTTRSNTCYMWSVVNALEQTEKGRETFDVLRTELEDSDAVENLVREVTEKGGEKFVKALEEMNPPLQQFEKGFVLQNYLLNEGNNSYRRSCDNWAASGNRNETSLPIGDVGDTAQIFGLHAFSERTIVQGTSQAELESSIGSVQEQLTKGNSVVLHIQNGGYAHFVTIVGLEKNLDDVTKSNFICLDSLTGQQTKLPVRPLTSGETLTIRSLGTSDVEAAVDLLTTYVGGKGVINTLISDALAKEKGGELEYSQKSLNYVNQVINLQIQNGADFAANLQLVLSDSNHKGLADTLLSNYQAAKNNPNDLTAVRSLAGTVAEILETVISKMTVSNEG